MMMMITTTPKWKTMMMMMMILQKMTLVPWDGRRQLHELIPSCLSRPVRYTTRSLPNEFYDLTNGDMNVLEDSTPRQV